MKKHPKNEPENLAELFRTDFISNMKVPDAEQLDYICRFCESWRHEWNCGIQVPIKDEKDPSTCPIFRPVHEIRQGSSKDSSSNNVATLYDSDLTDVKWLALLNQQLEKLGIEKLSKTTLELAFEQLELAAHGKPTPAEAEHICPNMIENDDTVCDVCRSPSWEDGNQIVFCDNCNVAVHQMCYGIKRIPKGSWFCRPCSFGVKPKCLLCPNRGGALKCNKSCEKWVHLSCALWVPEITFDDKETMEPAMNLNKIPSSRFSLRCSLCTNRGGVCIQCKFKACRVAYHVTCAQKHGLQLISIPDFEVTYCLKHAGLARQNETTPEKNNNRTNNNRKNATDDPKEWLLKVRHRFLEHTLNIPQYTAQSLLCYWRLKKLANYGASFIRLADSDKVVTRQHEEQLIRRVQLLMFLRQNMEKARNLCYMVERREKLKRQEYINAGEYTRKLYDDFERKSIDNNNNTKNRQNKILTNSALPNTSYSTTTTSHINLLNSLNKLDPKRRNRSSDSSLSIGNVNTTNKDRNSNLRLSYNSSSGFPIKSSEKINGIVSYPINRQQQQQQRPAPSRAGTSRPYSRSAHWKATTSTTRNVINNNNNLASSRSNNKSGGGGSSRVSPSKTNHHIRFFSSSSKKRALETARSLLLKRSKSAASGTKNATRIGQDSISKRLRRNLEYSYPP